MQKTKHWKKDLKYLILILIALVLLVEITVRLSWDEPKMTYTEGLIKSHETAGYALNPGHEGYLLSEKGYTIPVKINNRGLRDDNHDYQKLAGTIRIVALGDTVIFGSGIDYEETSMYLLEKEFKDRGKNVEIINTAAPAYQPISEINFYKSEGHKYDPDYVLMVLAMSDILEADTSQLRANVEEYGDLLPRDKPIEKLVKNICHTCIYVYSIAYNWDSGYTNEGYLKQVYDDYWQDEEEFRRLSTELTLLNNELKEEKIPFILAIIPYKIQMSYDLDYGVAPQKSLLAFTEQEGIITLDMYAHLNNRNYENYFSQDGRILSAKGHELLKEALHDKLSSIIF